MTGRYRWWIFEFTWSMDVRSATKLFRVTYWVFPLFTITTLGLGAILPFVDVAFLLRRPSVWRMAATYTVIDLVLWAILHVRLFVIDAPLGATVGLGILELSWLLCAVATAVVSCVQLLSLRGQVIEHLERTQVLGVTRPYTRNRTPIPDRIIQDGSGRDCVLLLVGLEQRYGGASPQSLFDFVAEAFDSSGIPRLSCLRYVVEDRMVVIVPRTVPKSRLIYPMLATLSARLRHHNRYAAPGTHLRARVAMHIADVRVDDDGPIGSPMAELTALFDAPPLQLALAEAPEIATVAVLVSPVFHDAVIRGGSLGVDPELFAPLPVTVRDAQTTAWLHVPGHANVRL